MNRINKTTLLLFIAMALGRGVTAAQTMLVVNASTGDGPQEISLDDIRKITFAGDDMTVGLASVTQSGVFRIPDVKSIKFKDDMLASIDAAKSDDDATLRLMYGSGVLTVAGFVPGSTVSATVFDVSGRSMISASRWDGTPISVADLPAGVYIFKVINKTIIFTK